MGGFDVVIVKEQWVGVKLLCCAVLCLSQPAACRQDGNYVGAVRCNVACGRKLCVHVVRSRFLDK